MLIKIENFKKVFPFNFKYSKSKKKYGLLIGDRIQTDANLRSLILANIIKKKYDCNSYLVSDVSDKKNIPVYNNVDIKNYSINFKFKNFKYFLIFLISLYDLFKFYFKTLFVSDKIEWLIKNFKCKKIKIGDLVYDIYIRYDLKFLDPSIYEIKFFKSLFIGILKTHFIDYLVKKNNIRFTISTQLSFTSYGNLISRYGTKYKLKTFTTGYNFVKKFNNHKETLTSTFKIRKKKITNNIKQIELKKIEKFYNLRKHGKLYGSYVPINTIRKIYGLSEDSKIVKFTKKINNIKKNHEVNVLALHCFSDSPHFCADMIFKDYYDQFLQTINFIRNNNKKTFWIIKPHPSRSQYHEEGIIEKVIYRYKSELENVIMCPEKINNSTLFKLSDNLINCVSTISLEFACYGKKSIIAGDAPYFHKDLFFKPKNKIEYFHLIKNLNKLKLKLNKKEIILAKRILYLIELESNNNLEKSRILPDIFLSKINETSYIKYLNENIKKNKNFSIFNDPLYKSLDSKLSKIIF